LVVACWDQQWDELKRSFTFSTGSFQPRRLDNDLLDFQVIPATMASSWRRLPGAREATPVASKEPWIRRAAEELHAPGPLTEWLREFGHGGRSEFKPLAKLFEIGSDPSQPNWLSDYLA